MSGRAARANAVPAHASTPAEQLASMRDSSPANEVMAEPSPALHELAKLRVAPWSVSVPGDRHERAAESAAARAFGTRASSRNVPSRTPPPVTPDVAAHLSRSGGSGSPLPERGEFEQRFQRSLGHVRVHHDEGAARAAAGLRARAFTHGRDIYFGRGAYAPSTGAGRSLIAHEIGHAIAPPTPRLIARQAVDAPPEPATATPGAQSHEAIATEIVGALDRDPADQSRAIRDRLAALPGVERQAVLSRVRARLDDEGQAQLAAALGSAGDASAAAARTGPRPVRPSTREDDAVGARLRAVPQRAAPSGASPTRRPAAQPPAGPAANADTTAAARDREGAEAAPLQAAREVEAQSADAQAAAETQTSELSGRAEAEATDADARGGDEESRLPTLAELMEPLDSQPASGDNALEESAISAAPTQAGMGAAGGAAGPAAETSAEATPPPALDTVAEAAPPAFDVQPLLEELSTAPTDAHARIQARADTARTSLRASAGGARAGVRSAVERSVAAIHASITARRTTLEASVAAAEMQIATGMTASMAEAAAAGESAKTALRDLFRTHRDTINTTVSDAVAGCERLRTEQAERARRRTREQATDARDRGRALTSTYSTDDRGWVQRNAAAATAQRTASEIEGRQPEVVAAVEEIVATMPEEFQQRGREALDGYDQGLPQMLVQIDDYVRGTQAQLEQQAQQARAQLLTLAAQLRQQLDQLEQAAVARAQAIGPQAEAQIDSGMRVASRRIDEAIPRAMEPINQTAGEAVQLLAEAESPNEEASRTFADQVLAFISGAADEAIAAFGDTEAGVAENLQRAAPAARQGLQAVQRQVDTDLEAATTAANQSITAAVDQTGEAFRQTIQLTTSALTDMRAQVASQLAPSVAQLRSDFATALANAGAQVRQSVNEGLAQNDQALRDLGPAMREAASDAAWDYDHPVLSTLRDIGLIVAGIIVGILAVIVLVVLVIVAFKLLVAGLVAAGISAAVASAIATVLGLGLLAYGIYTAYSARVAQGDSGWGALGGALLDMTGVTDIRRSFDDPNLSPFERGYAFGKGIATVATFFLGRRINNGINSRMPASITNPSRGAGMRWAWARLGRGPAAPPVAARPPVTSPATSAAASSPAPPAAHLPAAPAPARVTAPPARPTPLPARAAPAPRTTAPRPAARTATQPPAARTATPRPTAGGRTTPTGRRLEIVRSAEPTTPPAPARAQAGTGRPTSTARPPSPRTPQREGNVRSLAEYRAQRAARSQQPPTEPAQMVRPQQQQLAAGAEGHVVQPVGPSRPQLQLVRPEAAGGRSPVQAMASGRGAGGPRGGGPTRPPTPAQRGGSSSSSSRGGSSAPRGGRSAPARSAGSRTSRPSTSTPRSARGQTPPSSSRGAAGSRASTSSPARGGQRGPASSGGGRGGRGGQGGQRGQGGGRGGGRRRLRGMEVHTRGRRRKLPSDYEDSVLRAIDDLAAGPSRRVPADRGQAFISRLERNVVMATRRAMRTPGWRKMNSKQQGKLVHQEFRDLAGRLRLPKGWRIFPERQISSIPGGPPRRVLRMTVSEFIDANPGFEYLRTSLPERTLQSRIGNLTPDLVITAPGRQPRVWDLTGNPSSFYAQSHMAKSILYNLIFSRQNMLSQIGESYWRYPFWTHRPR